MTLRLIILFILSSFTLFSQNISEFEKKIQDNAQKDELDYDTNYILSYREKLTIKTYLSAKSDQLTQQGGIKRDMMTYEVNRPYRFGLGVSYKWLNLAATLFSPVTNSQLKEKGKTSTFDLRITTNGRTFLTDVWIQQFKGFYLANTLNVIPKWNKPGIFYQRKDISTFDFGGVVYYNLRHRKFSFKALFSQNERQLKSKGTPIVGVNWTVFQMKSSPDSSLVPYSITNNFKASEQINRINVRSLGLGVGYAYTLVFSKFWFLSLQGTYFVNAQTHRYHSKISPEEGTLYAGFRANVLWRTTFGYNSNKNYYGLIFIGNNVPLSRNKFSSDLHYLFNTLNLMYAHRFNVVKKKKKD
jgi:hypothetical protein